MTKNERLFRKSSEISLEKSQKIYTPEIVMNKIGFDAKNYFKKIQKRFQEPNVWRTRNEKLYVRGSVASSKVFENHLTFFCCTFTDKITLYNTVVLT